MTSEARSRPDRTGSRRSRDTRGIVIADGPGQVAAPPRIALFVWGLRVKPAPTLPFGRWKDVA